MQPQQLTKGYRKKWLMNESVQPFEHTFAGTLQLLDHEGDLTTF